MHQRCSTRDAILSLQLAVWLGITSWRRKAGGREETRTGEEELRRGSKGNGGGETGVVEEDRWWDLKKGRISWTTECDMDSGGAAKLATNTREGDGREAVQQKNARGSRRFFAGMQRSGAGPGAGQGPCRKPNRSGSAAGQGPCRKPLMMFGGLVYTATRFNQPKHGSMLISAIILKFC